MNEVYVSVDIESDGPIPSDNSMLSLGAAAFQNGELLSTFTVNLDRLPNSEQDPDTMKFWADNPEAYKETRRDCVQPKEGMLNFVKWLKSLPGRPIFVGYPASYDWLFVYWYLIHFTGESPFGFSGLDMKSYAAALLKIPFPQVRKKIMPKSWFPKDKHTHVALDDAIEQGKIWLNMLDAQKL